MLKDLVLKTKQDAFAAGFGKQLTKNQKKLVIQWHELSEKKS